MKVILQGVKNAFVTVDDNIVGAIESGLLIYQGFGEESAPKTIQLFWKKFASCVYFQMA